MLAVAFFGCRSADRRVIERFTTTQRGKGDGGAGGGDGTGGGDPPPSGPKGKDDRARAGIEDEYKVMIENMEREEMRVSGEERKGLAEVCVGTGRFLRRLRWRDTAQRHACILLAERAEAVALKCLRSVTPVGKA